MDFIEKLLPSRGFDTILVVVDRQTKFGLFIPLTHPFTSSQVAHLFIDNIYFTWNAKIIVTDKYKLFTSKSWHWQI